MLLIDTAPYPASGFLLEAFKKGSLYVKPDLSRLRQPFSVAAEPVALPPAELALLIPEADKLPSAMLADQTVGLFAPVPVPPLIAALATAEGSGLCPGAVV